MGSRAKRQGMAWPVGVSWLVALVAASGVLLLTAAGSAESANSHPRTCTPEPSVDGGATSYTSSIYGARAKISVQEGNICQPTGISYAWAMLLAHHTDGVMADRGYAQAGYGLYGNSYTPHSLHPFWQACNRYHGGSCSGFHGKVATDSTPDDGFYTCREVNGATTTVIDCGFDGQTLGQFNEPSDWTVGHAGKWAGEAYQLEDDVPGSAAHPADFTHVVTAGGLNGYNWTAPSSFALLGTYYPFIWEYQASDNDASNPDDFHIYSGRN